MAVAADDKKEQNQSTNNQHRGTDADLNMSSISKEMLQNDKDLLVLRHETPDDHRAVESMARLAFWNLYMPGCDEHYTVHTLRDHPDYLPELSFVAQINDTIVGCIMYSKSHVTEVASDTSEASPRTIPTVTFGPLCVHPDYQRLGIGRRLVDHSLQVAASMGYPAVVILGFPTTYCRYGFVNCRDWNIANAEGRFPYGQLVKILRDDHPFQKVTLQSPESAPPQKEEESPKPVATKLFQFHCSSAFEGMDQTKIDAFDATFPPLEKKEQYCQVEFAIALRAYLD